MNRKELYTQQLISWIERKDKNGLHKKKIKIGLFEHLKGAIMEHVTSASLCSHKQRHVMCVGYGITESPGFHRVDPPASPTPPHTHPGFTSESPPS